MTAYSLGRLQYNWTSEISRSFLCNIFPFPILITDRLVSVTGIIIICLSSRFLNKDGNCIHKPLFHTLLIHILCLFTLHAWVAILSLKIHDNVLTRMLQAPTHFQIFSHASICIYRILITLTHGCQLPPCCIWCSRWCLPSLPTHACGGAANSFALPHTPPEKNKTHLPTAGRQVSQGNTAHASPDSQAEGNSLGDPTWWLFQSQRGL